MLQEIRQQPAVIQTCLEKYVDLDWRATATTKAASPFHLGLPSDLLLQQEQIHLLACGTSRHAALVAQYWFEQVAALPARVRSASEFVVAPLPLHGPTLTIAITQSGETADTLAAVEQRRQAGPNRGAIVGITNQTDSSLAQRVDYLLPTLAGPEIGVAATKTFTSQLLVLLCLMVELAYRRQRLSETRLGEILDSLRTLPQALATLLQQQASIAAIASTLADCQHCIVLGQGLNRAIALEGALKLKETTYIHAEGYAAGEFLHGPIALIDSSIPVIALVPPDDTEDAVLQTIQKVKSYKAPVVGITTSSSKTPELFDQTIWLPEVDRWLSPFLTVIPLQILAYSIAVERHLNVDKPRNITKTLSR